MHDVRNQGGWSDIYWKASCCPIWATHGTDWAFFTEYDHTEVTIRDEAGKSNRNAMREAFAV